jgi:hypothetical protein
MAVISDYMEMKKILFYCFLVLHTIYPNITNAQSLNLNLENQVSGWFAIGFNDPVNSQLGGRYIPTLHINDSLKNNRIIDTELSVNTYGNLFFTGDKYEEGDAAVKAYRLWLRFATPRLELRAGLQKINFGSATILRPLMWFDKMDYRDPLQLTDGVYGLLGRYYFRNNANLWLWMLYGNNELKGWESVPTHKRTPEFGGRFQVPLGKGEAAISFHHREAELSIINDTLQLMYNEKFPEDRIGLDGKWDLGIGLWFEGVVKHNSLDNPLIKPWETYFNLGADYTFSLGNGLNTTAEYFRYSLKDELAGNGEHKTFIVLAANYPLGIMNSITAMIYYNYDEQAWYRIVNFQRRYDYWSFYLLAFWNPSELTLYSAVQDRNLFAGKGIMLMGVVNF